MIDTFLRYLEYERRYSLHTVQSYQNDLLQFESFLTSVDSNLHPKQVTYQHVRAWIISLVEDGLQPTTINRKVATLKSYFKFLLQREEISSDPTQRLQPLKVSKRLPQFVKEDDLNRLLDGVEFDNNFNGSRDQLILELLYGTGMRRAELIGLKDADINISSQQIKVLGKRNKERIIPVHNGLIDLVKNYLSQRDDLFGPLSHNHLIVTDKGKVCYPALVYRTVEKYLGTVVSLDKKSPHVLRHTYATHLLNKGADLNAVKDLLGHSSLAATQVYTHNSLEKLKRVFDQAHPKA